MLSFLIWVGGLLAVILIAHFTPKTQHAWLIIEAGLFLFWCCAGAMLFIRWAYRFIVKA